MTRRLRAFRSPAGRVSSRSPAVPQKGIGYDAAARYRNTSGVEAGDLAGDGRSCFVALRDQTVRRLVLHDDSTISDSGRFPGSEAPLSSLTLAPDGRHLVSGG